MSAHPLLLDVFDAFERSSLRWSTLLVHPNGTQPSHIVDLLVAHPDLEDARVLVMSIGFVPVAEWSDGSRLGFVVYHAGTDVWIRIDLVSRGGELPAEIGARRRRTTWMSAGNLRRTVKLGGPRRTGLTVALLGPDGAGKSSVADALIRHLPFRVVSIYMGRARTSSRGRRGSIASGLLRQWRRHLSATFHRLRGRIVLFDRYTYDALLPPRHPTPARIARRWVFAHAVPAPDLVVLLDAPAELMWQRKGEHPQDLLEQRRRDYLDLRVRLPEMVVVDAAQDLDAVRRDVTSAIWAAYRRRAGRGRSARRSSHSRARR
jgi:thymidylate kinase